ncbi:MAG: response regulator [Polyangiaceae bacterium]
MSPSAPPPSPFSQPSERTILLVEDHPAQREVIRRWLIEENFRVEIASDFHRASKVLEHEVPILFCVDTTLPRESGLEFCEHIRKNPRFGSVPILLFCDRGAPEDMANAEEAGANALLRKPFSREKLLKYVLVLLDGTGDPRIQMPAEMPADPPKLSA